MAGRLDEQADDWIRRIVQSAERTTTLIKDLLAYSRVDSQPAVRENRPRRRCSRRAFSAGRLHPRIGRPHQPRGSASGDGRPPLCRLARPDLVLLDLNMPRMTGQEVLVELSADERLRDIPIVILTTSADEKEILDMYKLKCSSYIVKPVDFDKFLRLIRVLAEYWLTVVALPRGSQ